MNALADNRPHNGVVIDAEPLQPDWLDHLPAPAPSARPPLWLLLDSVADPANLGAVLRCAAFFCVDGVVLCAKNSAPLSPVASKASAGALESVALYRTRSAVRFLQRSRAEGWRTVGLSAEAAASDCRAFACDSATVLVVGNEGVGLRPLVRQQCAELVAIRSAAAAVSDTAPVDRHANARAPEPLLDSLNVSAALAIALFQCSLSEKIVTDDWNVLSASTSVRHASGGTCTTTIGAVAAITEAGRVRMSCGCFLLSCI